MGSFADAMLGMLFGWLQALINWIWGVVDRGGSALGTWFLQNWLPLTLLLIAGGLVVDWFIWLIRWRPYHVWGTRLRRIGRFFRRAPDGEEPGGFAYAEGYGAAEEAPMAEDDPGYDHAYQTEIYAPTSAQAPLLADFPGDTYVDAPMPEEGYENLDFDAGEDPPADEGEAVFDAYPEDESQWAAWPPGEDAPAEPSDWAADAEPVADWGEAPFENVQDAEDFAYRELIPLDEEEDTGTEPLWPEDEAEPDEAAEMEAEEAMYDDFSNRGAPEPPQKRRRWEFPEEDAPATTRRSRPAAEDLPPPRRNSRPAEPPAPSRRRRDMNRDDAAEPMVDVDPLAAYDAPEVMEQIVQQRPRKQDRDAYDPVEAAGENAEPRRRRRSTRRRRSEAAQVPAQEDEAYADYPEAYPEEPFPEEAYEAPEEAPRRRGRSGRSGRSRGRAQEVAEGNNDFAEEEPYYEEPYEEEDLPRGGYDDGGYDDGGYDNDAYYNDDPYAEDLPDSPAWPRWEEEPELPRGNRGVTKPSLFDRLRGLSSPTRTPMPEEEDYYDDPYDDAYEDEVEVRPKKKGLLSRWLNPEQPEFQQSKPKPRVRQEDAYNEPVYPPKKRR